MKFEVVLFVLMIVYSVIMGNKVKHRIQSQKDTTNSKQFRESRANTFATVYTQKKQARKQRDVKLLRMENKDNDWLAKQLRAEQQAQIVVSDMFQLKQEHLRHCDSETVRYNNSVTANRVIQNDTKMSQSEMDALKEKIRQRTNV